MKGNKGEWSEWYAFLKILEQRRIFAADRQLNVIDDKYFIFHKIIRNEAKNEVKIYDLSRSEKEIYITDVQGEVIKIFKDEALGAKTVNIFKKIKNSSGSSFGIEEAENMMADLLCTEIKADHSKKSDIIAIIEDRISATMPQLGFSVKSMIGGSSTLFNAGKNTNFIFKVEGFNGAIDNINALQGRTKIQDRIQSIQKQGGRLTFHAVASETLEANLKKIDTAFPSFIAQMLLAFSTRKALSVKELTETLPENEHLKEKFGLSLSDFEYKMKNFLDSVALGMVAGKPWDGFIKAYGGYIVVKEDGQVVCYHLYNRDEFHAYLYENTKFETASSTRHNFGTLYKKDEEIFFNLNLQIRFKR